MEYLRTLSKRIDNLQRKTECYKMSRVIAQQTWTTKLMESFFEGYNRETPLSKLVKMIGLCSHEPAVLALADVYFERTGRMALSY